MATIEGALSIAQECKRIRHLLGNQARYPYHEYQIVDALIAFLDAYDATAVPKSLLTESNRRCAALNAQIAKLKKRLGITTNDDSDTSDVAEESGS